MIFALFVVLVVLFVVLPLIGMALWAFVSTVIVGLIIGGLGRLVAPGPRRIGLLATVFAGLCGSILGGFLGQSVLDLGPIATFLVEIGVSAAVVMLMTGRSRRRPVIR